MMAPEYYTFTGSEVIPRHVTHVLIAEALNFVRSRAFQEHPNIQELICHDGVEKIEEEAFCKCPSLRWIIMPGVKQVGERAFNECKHLLHIECGKLEIIGANAFGRCESLSSIDLPSIKIVEAGAFSNCTYLINAKFGKDLESIRVRTFYLCPSLECIALPLKNGVMADDESIFRYCKKLHHVDLVGGVHENVAALLLDHWKNDMKEEIVSINRILPNTHAGKGQLRVRVVGYDEGVPNTTAGTYYKVGGKTHAIRTWITLVLRKYTHYKAEHRRYLNVAAAALQQALPSDIVQRNVLPFVELPSDTFEREELLAREEQAKEMMATRMQQLSLSCKHGANPICLKVGSTVFQFVYAFRKGFDEAVERGDLHAENFLIAAKDATMDKFAYVWDDSTKMEMAMLVLLCKGTQDILEGEFLDAQKSAIFVRYFEQYIAIELHQTQALYNWPKLEDTYTADIHKLVIFFRHRIPCYCLDEKYEEVKSIPKMGFWLPAWMRNSKR